MNTTHPIPALVLHNFLHSLCVLQHLLPPEFKEIVWICVELQSILAVVSASARKSAINKIIDDKKTRKINLSLPICVEFVQWRRMVTLIVRLQHGSRNGLPGHHLLLKECSALESLPQMNILK